MRQKKVSFTTDKNGKPIAYRQSMAQMRNFRISVSEAKMLIALGNAVEVPYRTFDANKRQNRARQERDQAMRDLGLTKVRGAMGGTYWE